MKKSNIIFVILAFISVVLVIHAADDAAITDTIREKTARLAALEEKCEIERQKILFENSKYSSNITIKANVVTEDMLSASVSDREPSVKPGKIKGDLTYLVLRLRNDGGSIVWGTLNCKIDHRNFNVVIPGLDPRSDGKFRIFVIPLDGMTDMDLTTLEIKCTWKEIYTKG